MNVTLEVQRDEFKIEPKTDEIFIGPSIHNRIYSSKTPLPL